MDIRDIFIKGPYIKCPKCGKNAFGILMIHGNQYSRRCRECYSPHPNNNEDPAVFSLPGLDKKVIYLDQFSISNMMKFLNPKTKAYQKGRVDSFWGELFGKLDELVKLQLIVCPYSDFHKHESLPAEFYPFLKRLYKHLSGEVSFLGHETIQRFQIMRQFRIWLGDTGVRDYDVHTMTEGQINAWLSNDFSISVRGYESQELIDELRNNRENIAKKLTKVFERWHIEKDKDFDYWYEQERIAHGKLLLDQHVKYRAELFAAMHRLITPHPGYFFPDMSTILFYNIKERLAESGVPENKLDDKLREFLISNEFKESPYIVIASMLHAVMAQRASVGRKQPPSRGYMMDIHMISTLLPYCDAMFIDKECASLLKEERLQREISKYKTETFSMSSKKEFLLYLDKIKKEASPEHMRAVKEVYGEDGAIPYWEIFQTKQR